MVKKMNRAGAKAAIPTHEVTLANLDVATIPEGGVLVRLPLFPEEYITRDEYQPRTKFNSGKMEKLKASLASRGQLQYPRVRWMYVGSSLRFVLDDGERRTRNYRELGWKDAIYVVLPEEYKPGYDADRELGQAAANTSQERLTVGEIVHLTKRVVAAEIANRKHSGASEAGAITTALTKIDRAFGENPGWSQSYRVLGKLTNELLDMLDGDDDHEPQLKWGDAISLATAPQEKQMALLKRARELFPKNPHARRTFISREARGARESKGEKVRGRGADDKARFLNYPNQLVNLAERVTEGRTAQENTAYMRQMLGKMGTIEIEQLLKVLRSGLAPFVELYRLAKIAREDRLVATGLKFTTPDELEEENAD